MRSCCSAYKNQFVGGNRESSIVFCVYFAVLEGIEERKEEARGYVVTL